MRPPLPTAHGRESSRSAALGKTRAASAKSSLRRSAAAGRRAERLLKLLSTRGGAAAMALARREVSDAARAARGQAGKLKGLIALMRAHASLMTKSARAALSSMPRRVAAKLTAHGGLALEAPPELVAAAKAAAAPKAFAAEAFAAIKAFAAAPNPDAANTAAPAPTHSIFVRLQRTPEGPAPARKPASLSVQSAFPPAATFPLEAPAAWAQTEAPPGSAPPSTPELEEPSHISAISDAELKALHAAAASSSDLPPLAALSFAALSVSRGSTASTEEEIDEEFVLVPAPLALV